MSPPTLADWGVWITTFLFLFFPILGVELRAFTLSHLLCVCVCVCVCVMGIMRYGLVNYYMPGLASNCDPPDLCLLK
jgi:hypothetical protein